MPRIILFALVAFLLVSACSPGRGARPAGLASPSAIRTAPLPQVVVDCQHFSLRPVEILVACGDGNYALKEARYERWTASAAVGHAVALTNTCEPNCAEGTMVRVPVRFTLDREQLIYGVPLFTRLTVVDARTGRPLLTTPLLPLDCSVEPPSCPPSPAP